MSHLHIATRSHIDQLTNKRPGETKLGEVVQTVHPDTWQEELQKSDTRFVLLGIPEDIGVRANYGLGGTHTLWEPALRAILNVQHTDSLDGSKLLVLGDFNFRDLMQRSEHADVLALRELVAHIDEEVAPVIQAIVAAGKIPLVVGGGHNNAFPLLQGASQALDKIMNCINLDAHSDYRIMEGRHSGNGFRYAKKKGYLDKYAIVGLHKNYNAQEVLNDMSADPGFSFSFFEDIMLDEHLSFEKALSGAISHTSDGPCGIELDLDCIEHTLSSAATPSGFGSLHARRYVSTCAHNTNLAYLHITEGATKLRNGKDDLYTAKLVAYLVTDFIRASG